MDDKPQKTLAELMAEIAEKHEAITEHQTAVAKIADEIKALEKEGFGIKTGQNLGLPEMVKLVKRVVEEEINKAKQEIEA